MALAKKNSNSTRFVVVAAVVVAVAGIGYLLFMQFFLKNTNGSNVNGVGRHSVVTNFGESILNDSRFTSLKSFEKTVNADANVDGGQNNPFR